MSAQHETDNKRLDDALAVLAEHFDTVMIFVSRYDGGDAANSGTVRATRSSGNFFARYGQVRHWLIAEDEATRKLVHDGE